MAGDISLAALERILDDLGPSPFRSPMSLFGMPVYVAPEYPRVRLNYKCRTKYGDEFDFLTPKQQAETDAWLIAQFGTTTAVGDGMAFMFNMGNRPSLMLNARDVVKLTNIC